ncbi:MAG TPA: hypothetical protein PLL20_10510 [Phycisphaerae bacterium]|nr:hypothetical protein [Phycisphaerae bacterium]HRR87414.1 hypothetical protein [Phycisphaerae bacterium]
MAGIKAHFDGRALVPDEPAQFRPGEQVVIERLGEAPSKAAPGVNVSFGRKLNIDLDARSVCVVAEEPERSFESL